MFCDYLFALQLLCKPQYRSAAILEYLAVAASLSTHQRAKACCRLKSDRQLCRRVIYELHEGPKRRAPLVQLACGVEIARAPAERHRHTELSSETLAQAHGPGTEG